MTYYTNEDHEQTIKYLNIELCSKVINLKNNQIKDEIIEEILKERELKTIENNIDFLWELMNSKLDNNNYNLTSSRVMGKKCCGVFD